MSKIKTKNIQEFKNKALPIVEIFGNTLQGEGPRLRPAIFVRTGLCNFTCAGFGCTREAPDSSIVQGCDTIHAVSKKFKSKWKEYTNYMDLVEDINYYIFPNPDIRQDIIITGGEPTLHWNNLIFQQMLEYFISRGHHVTIESNGSRDIEFTREYQHKIMFSLSVKLSNSGEPEKKRINIPAIQNITQNTQGSYLKFVVSREGWEQQHREINNILRSLPTWVDVYLMPMGETRSKQMEQIPFVFEKAAELGFSISPRLHILAFDDMDGV